MNNTDIRPLKQELRKACKERRRAFTPESKKTLDASIAALFLMTEAYENADTVFGYVSMDLEVDTFAILEQALKDGKTVVVPRCRPGTREMDFYEITEFAQLEPGAFGVLEPNVDVCDRHTDFSKGVCLVPALAYDRDGYRLGFGKGYYDRFLPHFGGTAVGLTYNCCLYDDLPRGKFDCPVNWLITEDWLYCCTQ